MFRNSFFYKVASIGNIYQKKEFSFAWKTSFKPLFASAKFENSSSMSYQKDLLGLKFKKHF